MRAAAPNTSMHQCIMLKILNIIKASELIITNISQFKIEGMNLSCYTSARLHLSIFMYTRQQATTTLIFRSNIPDFPYNTDLFIIAS